MSTVTQITVEVTTDTVCPWCFVGHRKLLAAVNKFASAHPTVPPIKIVYSPYQLNPHSPRGESFDKQVYYIAKFGEERTKLIHQRLKEASAGTGINFAFGGHTGNTLDSHRLIWLAGQMDCQAGVEGDLKRGVQGRVMEELYSAYFEKEEDLTSIPLLIKVADRAGLPKTASDLEIFFKTDGFEREVSDTAKNNAYRKGVTGVPYFSISANGKFVGAFGGANEDAVFLRIFEKIMASS